MNPKFKPGEIAIFNPPPGAMDGVSGVPYAPGDTVEIQRIVPPRVIGLLFAMDPNGAKPRPEPYYDLNGQTIVAESCLQKRPDDGQKPGSWDDIEKSTGWKPEQPVGVERG